MNGHSFICDGLFAITETYSLICLTLMENTGMTKREVFFDKTLKLFHKKGFRATTMRDIAENMGFEVANVYNYIDNKQSLLRNYLAAISDEFQRSIRNINNSSYGAKEKLRAVVGMHIRIASQKPYAVALLLDEYRNLEEPQLSRFIYKRNEYEQILADIIQSGIDRKEIRPLNAEVATQTVIASLRWLNNWYAKNGTTKINPIEMEKQIMEILFSGLSRVDP